PVHAQAPLPVYRTAPATALLGEHSLRHLGPPSVHAGRSRASRRAPGQRGAPGPLEDAGAARGSSEARNLVEPRSYAVLGDRVRMGYESARSPGCPGEAPGTLGVGSDVSDVGSGCQPRDLVPAP